MIAAIFYLVSAGLIFFLYLLYKYVCNYVTAAALNVPLIHLPLVDQNNVLWIILGPITRPWLQKKLPAWIFDRIILTIFGVEFFAGNKPWERFVWPQVKANPQLEAHKKSYFLVTSGRLELWTSDANLVQELTTRPNDFQTFELTSLFMDLFGKNVLSSNGETWRRHRRIVAGAVTEKVSSVVFGESVRQTRALIHTITNRNGRSREPSVEAGDTYRMFDNLKQVAIHVLYAAGMGNRQDFSDDESIRNDDTKLAPGESMTYIDAVKTVNENLSGLNLIPTPILVGWPRWLPWSELFHKAGQAKIAFPRYTRAALERERKLAQQSHQIRNNVMGALITASDTDPGDEKGTLRKGPALTEDELVGNLYVFTAAGFDTTANTLAYALVHLARYPRWQHWLFEELDEILPADKSSDFEYTRIFPRAHRTLCIMLETLRLFPPILHIIKQTKSPVTLTTASEGVLTIPTNTTIYINNIVLHRDPEIWRNLNVVTEEDGKWSDKENGALNDEDVFRPSRWMNPPGSSSPIFQPPKGTYLAWSAGSRVCPGQKMAQVEFVGVLATLFGQYSLEPLRRTSMVNNSDGGPGKKHVMIPESDIELRMRIDQLIQNSMPKLALELDVYNIKPGEERGLGLRWKERARQ